MCILALKEIANQISQEGQNMKKSLCFKEKTFLNVAFFQFYHIVQIAIWLQNFVRSRYIIVCGYGLVIVNSNIGFIITRPNT